MTSDQELYDKKIILRGNEFSGFFAGGI